MTGIIFSLVVAMTIYGEAGVEDYRGKQLVAATIYNNANLERAKANITFHQALSKACLKKKLYSCWNEPFEIDYDSKAWADSIRAARELHNEGYMPPTKATNYHGNYIRKPYWVKDMVFLGSHGQHLFYKVKRTKRG